MDVIIRAYEKKDLENMRNIWNQVVEEGNSFPQESELTKEEAELFFGEQSYVGVAEDSGAVVGLYILHPNNIGRCGHLSNASYAVSRECRGKHIGEKLVRDSMQVAASLGFHVLQFNAVVASNKGAIHLYEKLGFQALGTIPGGFRKSEDVYEDIVLFYVTLNK